MFSVNVILKYTEVLLEPSENAIHEIITNAVQTCMSR